MEIRVTGYLREKDGSQGYFWNHFNVSEDEIFDWLNQRFQDGDFGCPINLNREDLVMDCSIDKIEF